MKPITQENLYLILPSKVSWLAEMLSEDNNISVVEAIRRIYSSNLYSRLEIEKNKLWHSGPVDLYNEMKEKS